MIVVNFKTKNQHFSLCTNRPGKTDGNNENDNLHFTQPLHPINGKCEFIEPSPKEIKSPTIIFNPVIKYGLYIFY